MRPNAFVEAFIGQQERLSETLLSQQRDCPFCGKTLAEGESIFSHTSTDPDCTGAPE